MDDVIPADKRLKAVRKRPVQRLRAQAAAHKDEGRLLWHGKFKKVLRLGARGVQQLFAYGRPCPHAVPALDFVYRGGKAGTYD